MELTTEIKTAGPAASGAPTVLGQSSTLHLQRKGLRNCARRGHSSASPAAFLIPFLLILLFAGAAVACPSCKTAGSSENPAAADKLTQGWARSIYLLMWTPYILFGGVTFAIVRSARRSKKP